MCGVIVVNKGVLKLGVEVNKWLIKEFVELWIVVVFNLVCCKKDLGYMFLLCGDVKIILVLWCKGFFNVKECIFIFLFDLEIG